MKLSSAYLYEQLAKQYQIVGHSGLSGSDGYLRPFLLHGKARCGRKGSGKTVGTEGNRSCDPPQEGHVYVIPAEADGLQETMAKSSWPGCLRVFCVTGGLSVMPEESSGQESSQPGSQPAFPSDEASGACICVAVEAAATVTLDAPDISEVMNAIQRIFDCCDEWDRTVNELLTQNAGMGRILEVTSRFLQNPLLVMGLDFSLTAEAGTEVLPERAKLFTGDGVNMDYMNALLQNPLYQEMLEKKETFLFPAYIGSCRSLNRNLYVEGQATHRLVLTEYQTPVTPGDTCILEALTGRLEYLLSHEVSPALTGDLEQIFERILSDRTADYMQISRQLSAQGWSSSHTYLCLILQITYLNQKQLSTKAICHYIKKQFSDSISFLYQDEIVTFFNLSRLGITEDEVNTKLVYFIRDSYLKAGYSRTMRGHMDLRRQYVQARTALDVGSRKKPYLWIHHFSQVALTYIMEQATRRLPGNMLCHEGLLKLQELDKRNNTEYTRTLKTFLEQHFNATQTARELFIHRSTFLYRMEKIREILQSDLEDPEELFYLELSLRLLEQEEKEKV